MNYYQQQVTSINAQLYSNIHLVKQVIQARHFIGENFSGNISLNIIAKEACISKFHLIRSFKKLYGRTPNQFLTEMRISKAKELLSYNMPVSEVCFHVGLESHSSFTGLFKKYVGRTPATFKKSFEKSKIEELPLI